MLQEIYDINDMIKIPFNMVFETFKFKICVKNHVPSGKVFANLITNNIRAAVIVPE